MLWFYSPSYKASRLTMLKKFTKVQHIWLYRECSRRTTALCHALSENSHWADVSSWLTCNGVSELPFLRYLQSNSVLEAQKLTPSLFFVLTFGGPLRYRQRGEDMPGTLLYHHAKFHSDRLNLQRDICPRTKLWKTIMLISFHTP